MSVRTHRNCIVGVIPMLLGEKNAIEWISPGPLVLLRVRHTTLNARFGRVGPALLIDPVLGNYRPAAFV